MSEHLLEREQVVPGDLDKVFAFFSEAANLEQLTPPWLRFEMRTPEPIIMRPGALIEYRLRVHGIPMRWVSRIEQWDAGRGFVDTQVHGPYHLWHHTHTFAAHPGGTLVGDRVRYALPLGPLGEIAHRLLVRRDIERIFDYRREAVTRVLA